MRTRQGHMFRRNGIWTVQYRVGGKLFSRSTGKRNRREAETERARIMAPLSAATEKAVLEGIQGRIGGLTEEITRAEEQGSPPLSVSDAWNAFIAAPSRPDSSEVTLTRYADQWKAFERWLAEEHPTVARLCDVSATIAGEYAAHLRTKNGAGTFNKHIRLCSLVCRTLHNPARMDVNPFDREGIRRLRNVQTGRRELTIDELRRVCRSATGDLRILFALGLYTGLRFGDSATLRWSEVDMVRRIICRTPNKTARRNPNPVRVPIYPDLHAILAELPRRGEYVIPDAASTYKRSPSTLSRRIQALFEACGIRTTQEGTGKQSRTLDAEGKPIPGSGRRAVVLVGFHSLRHSFVSLCRAAGAPLSVVEAIVGHSSPAMTQHYTHTSEEAAAKAIAALPSINDEAPALLPTASAVSVAEPKPKISAEVRASIRKIATKITAKTWATARDELLKLAGE